MFVIYDVFLDSQVFYDKVRRGANFNYIEVFLIGIDLAYRFKANFWNKDSFYFYDQITTEEVQDKITFVERNNYTKVQMVYNEI